MNTSAVNIVMLTLGVALCAVVYKGDAWDRALMERQARSNLEGVRGEVAKALNEGKPLEILLEPPVLWFSLLAAMPHAAGSSVSLRTNRAPQDTGYWAYDNDSQRVYIDCTHTDSRGAVWTSY